MVLAVAVATLTIFALVFVRVKRKRAALLRHDYDYAIPQLPKSIQNQQQNTTDGRQESGINTFPLASTTSHEGEPTELNSLYATIGDTDADVCIRMDENSVAHQSSTNFSFARNPAYGTDVGIAHEIELRGKCIDQMKEKVKLHETGALSDAEFERERLYYVNKMQELK